MFLTITKNHVLSQNFRLSFNLILNKKKVFTVEHCRFLGNLKVNM